MTDDSASDHRLPEILFALLDERGPDRTICPSEVARRAAGDDGGWRLLMPAVHRLAAQRAASGDVVLMQKGRPVGSAPPSGPYRIGRAGAAPATSPPSGRSRRP